MSAQVYIDGGMFLVIILIAVAAYQFYCAPPEEPEEPEEPETK